MPSTPQTKRGVSQMAKNEQERGRTTHAVRSTLRLLAYLVVAFGPYAASLVVVLYGIEALGWAEKPAASPWAVVGLALVGFCIAALFIGLGLAAEIFGEGEND